MAKRNDARRRRLVSIGVSMAASFWAIPIAMHAHAEELNDPARQATNALRGVEHESPVVDAARPNEQAAGRDFRDSQGRVCRVYERRVVIDGAPRTALATVCRDASGRWVLSR